MHQPLEKLIGKTIEEIYYTDEDEVFIKMTDGTTVVFNSEVIEMKYANANMLDMKLEDVIDTPSVINWKITNEDLQAWKKVFEEASKDPNFKVICHPAIEVK